MIGAAVVAFSRGLRSGQATGGSGTAWEARLLDVAGSGLIGAGLVTTDPVFGYPPEAPLLLEQENSVGHLHNLTSLLFFVGLPGACFVAGRRCWQAGKYPWAIYSLFSGLAMLVTFVLAGVGFTQHPRLVQRAGVVQRLSIVTGLAWITLRAARLFRAARA